MKYIKAHNGIEASKQDWTHLRRIARLKPQTAIPNLGRWRGEDDGFLKWAMLKPVKKDGRK